MIIFETLTPTLTPLSQTMPSLAFDVSEVILDATDSLAHDPIIPARDDPALLIRDYATILSVTQLLASLNDRPCSSQ